jgi:inner membrane protein
VPTVFSHPAVPLVLRSGLGRELVSRRLLVAGVLASALPDLDVVAFRLGVPYWADLGHRGLTHSLLFAALVALAGAAAHRALRSGFAATFVFLFVSAASHGLLDSLTNGGFGVALLWPFTGQRFFAPDALRVIEVSPIGVSRFLSPRGLVVLGSELRWVWLPALAVGLVLTVARRAWARPGGRHGHGGTS